MMARWVIITTIIITIIINHCPNNDGEVGQITFAQTLGAGSVEEQLAFEARYEFVTITKVGGDHDHDDGDDDNHQNQNIRPNVIESSI